MVVKNRKLMTGLLLVCMLCFILSGCGSKNTSINSKNDKGTGTESSTNNNGATTVNGDKNNSENSTKTTTGTTTSPANDTKPKEENTGLTDDYVKLMGTSPKEMLAKDDSEFIKISSHDLIKEFEDNRALADSKYRYKLLEVTGQVNSIEKGSNSCIDIYSGDQQNDVYCWVVDKNEADRILSLNLTMYNGDTVTVRGVYYDSKIDKGYMNVMLGACALKAYTKK